MMKVELTAVGQLMLLASCLASWEEGSHIIVLLYFHLPQHGLL
jgi:tRNA (Thr-GGU) A37 N-methylase